MCKCCQECFESCWWNFIEERFCFDESIAKYEDPIIKQEKNNNFADNMAFYDSVSVIAGRAIVTIDPLPEKRDTSPILDQPRKRSMIVKKSKSQTSIQNIPSLVLESSEKYESLPHDDVHFENNYQDYISPVKKTVSFGDISSQTLTSNLADTPSKSESAFLAPPVNVELRKKSLSERRQSRSLHLKIHDFPKEVPIIRQSSVPKFFLDTPEVNQAASTLFKTPLTSLQSPMISKDAFIYDLKSVVQMENMNISEKEKGVREKKNVALVHRESSSSKLANIRDKIMLKKSKSTVSTSNLPHSNYI